MRLAYEDGRGVGGGDHVQVVSGPHAGKNAIISDWSPGARDIYAHVANGAGHEYVRFSATDLGLRWTLAGFKGAGMDGQ